MSFAANVIQSVHYCRKTQDTMKIKRNRLRKLIPAYTASIIDVAVTAIYQPSAYRQGELSQSNEANPIGGPSHGKAC